ncbi:10179_t:CDS:2, partial [Acaulospora colombiana]
QSLYSHQFYKFVDPGLVKVNVYTEDLKAVDIKIQVADILGQPIMTKIESVLIKDIKFSQELQASLSSAAQQKRIGESKVIAAQAE